MRGLATLLALSFALGGLLACDDAPPVVVETRVVSDTSLESGPYEVLVAARDPAGVASATLFWTARGVGDRVPMVAEALDEGRASVRFAAGIPGQRIGTEVRWGVEVCDARGNCGTEPLAYPETAFHFLVGKVPSSPRIDEVKPERGPSSGGTRVEISGDDFRVGVVVSFDGQPALFTEYVRGDLVAALAPPHAPGVVGVQVTNPDGKAAALADGFTYFPAPELDDVTPAEGPTSGGTPVVLRGRHLGAEVRAFFDGVACRHHERPSEEELRCVTPPGQAGLVDVEVAGPGLGAAVLEEGYLYVAPPVVDVVAPSTGTDLGGTVIVIEGEEFHPEADVFVDGVACDEVIFESAGRLLCVTPPGSPGVVDVVVVNPDGQMGTAVGGFSYLGPPVVIQIDPPHGPIAGEVEVRVLGAGLTLDTAVYFGDDRAELLELVDPLEMRVRLPPTSLGEGPVPDEGTARVDVTVVNELPEDGRSDTLPSGFLYFWPPEVTLVVPPSGPTAGGTEVLVQGRFFRLYSGGELEASFDEELELLDVELLSSTVLRARTPPGPPGFVDVSVQNFDSSRGTLAAGFEYIPPPEVERVEPEDGPTFGGERVTVHGAFFREGASVTFDGAPCSDVIFISPSELSCVTPAGEEGFADVVVVNPDGQQGMAEAAYEYLGVIVQPDVGLPVGFTRVRVLAAGMQPGVSVRFGDALATGCTFVNEREVVCQTPANAVGDVAVSFVNPDGTSVTSSQPVFSYRRYLDRTEGRLDSNGANANHVEAGDVDGDGDLDLIVANGRPSAAETDDLWLNDGDGIFTRQPLGTTSAVSNKATFGDLDGDDRPDVVVAVSGAESGGALLLRNDGGGVFTAVSTPGSTRGAFDAQLVDLLGDERDDLFILSIGCSDDEFGNCGDLAEGRDGLFERTGAGGFTDRSSLVPHDVGLVHDHKFEAIDLDGDGDLDLVVFADNRQFSSPDVNLPNRHRILWNHVDQGQGFVEDADPFAGLLGEIFGIDSGDINGDGRPDIVAPSCFPPAGSSELVFVNDGTTLVQSFNAMPAPRGGCMFGAHLVDVDRDGDLDLAFAGDVGGDLTLRLYVNRGDGTFVDASPHVPSWSVLARGSQVASGDFDGDGDVDLALGAAFPEEIGLGDGDLRILLLE